LHPLPYTNYINSQAHSIPPLICLLHGHDNIITSISQVIADVLILLHQFIGFAIFTIKVDALVEVIKLVVGITVSFPELLDLVRDIRGLTSIAIIIISFIVIISS